MEKSRGEEPKWTWSEERSQYVHSSLTPVGAAKLYSYGQIVKIRPLPKAKPKAEPIVPKLQDEVPKVITASKPQSWTVDIKRWTLDKKRVLRKIKPIVCLHCRYVWTPNKMWPKECPKCGNRWNKPPVNKHTGKAANSDYIWDRSLQRFVKR